MLKCEMEGGAIGRGEQLGLAGAAAAPDRADRVNDMAGGQPVAAGDARLARRAAADAPAFLQQFRPGGTMDGAVDASAAEQAFIGSVNDCVDVAAW